MSPGTESRQEEGDRIEETDATPGLEESLLRLEYTLLPYLLPSVREIDSINQDSVRIQIDSLSRPCVTRTRGRTNTAVTDAHTDTHTLTHSAQVS